MTIEYSLTEDDFLEYQFYIASKSKLNRKRRTQARIFISLAYLILGAYFLYQHENYVIGGALVIFAVSWFVLYPYYSKWRYRRYLKGFIRENYSNRVNQSATLILDSDAIEAKSGSSKSSIAYSEIESLIERENHFFIQLVTNLSLIVPKRALMNDAELISKLTSHGAKYLDEAEKIWK